ncbi:peroxiredoxin-like family protein [Pricia sp. S334]|uniref:Peroxiredoxin-like family protein n=1 Tax=Pricia mediterranea TaxID=3076079 RepID=A0ABU3LA54_9FLAO|nr:peroxiredoxin-like family protein [Pricia sp. S334]MDT7830557.1 peroxiredoxin-like family protein [Pricia sp. S334]
MIKPRQEVPDLKLELINDTQWNLEAQQVENFTMLVFYRGLHCPECKKQLEALANKLEDFSDRGVNIIAASCDSEKLAKKTAEEWDITALPVGYGLSIEEAREWGLFISEGIKDEEPEQFSEPGLFLVRPDKTLYAASVQTMPFARPKLDDLLKAIDFIKKKDYPARGEA